MFLRSNASCAQQQKRVTNLAEQVVAATVDVVRGTER